MLELVTLMWATAILFALSGALRGCRREFTATAGILLGFFAIFQFDSLLRGSLYIPLTNEVTFTLQTLLYLGVVCAVYRTRIVQQVESVARTVRRSLAGVAVGVFNGYILAGSIWYSLDIDRYPFAKFISAPAGTSASFQSLGVMPISLLGGGQAGNSALLAVVVLMILAVLVPSL